MKMSYQSIVVENYNLLVAHIYEPAFIYNDDAISTNSQNFILLYIIQNLG